VCVGVGSLLLSALAHAYVHQLHVTYTPHILTVRWSWTATALRSCTYLCTSASRCLHSSHTHCTLELDCYCSPLLHRYLRTSASRYSYFSHAYCT
jgi:hypothetical protein